MLPDLSDSMDPKEEPCLNPPTGAWCSLTVFILNVAFHFAKVSMHLQVRGAP